MKAFVTGGAGFIGSHLLRRLLKAEKTERVVYDNFNSGNEVTLQVLTSDRRLSVVEADLKDAGRVREVMNGCDTIFHPAANPDIAKAITQPDIDFWEGTYLTQNVLEAMQPTAPVSWHLNPSSPPTATCSVLWLDFLAPPTLSALDKRMVSATISFVA